MGEIKRILCIVFGCHFQGKPEVMLYKDGKRVKITETCCRCGETYSYTVTCKQPGEKRKESKK